MYQNESINSYIRSVLGYPIYDTNRNGMGMNTNYMMEVNQNMNMDYLTKQNSELEECYPEIYKIVYPMVLKRCSNVTGSVTRDLVEEMTREIYEAVEGDNHIQININLQNEVQNTNMNRAAENKAQVNMAKKESTGENRQSSETKQENRQMRNSTLQDLIRILIIRELLRRNRPNRPPFRPRSFDSSLYEIW